MNILQFGKYKGRPVTSVPEDYLLWMVEWGKQTQAMAEQELARRELAAEADASWAERIVKAGYRALMQKHHPDVEGGSNEDAKEINAAYEMMRERVR